MVLSQTKFLVSLRHLNKLERIMLESQPALGLLKECDGIFDGLELSGAENSHLGVFDGVKSVVHFEDQIVVEVKKLLAFTGVETGVLDVSHKDSCHLMPELAEVELL